MHTITDVVDHAGKVAPAVRFEFAHGQVQGKGGTVLAASAHFATNANDLLDARCDVAGKVAVMLFLDRVPA